MVKTKRVIPEVNPHPPSPDGLGPPSPAMHPAMQERA
jgi:hypothetical protein